MIWTRLVESWRTLDEQAQSRFQPWERFIFRLVGYFAVWLGLVHLNMLPAWMTAVVIIPFLDGMVLAGGPLASRTRRLTPVVAVNGNTLMAISATFAVGALIGLSILNPDSTTTCDDALWTRQAVMWWAITTGAWTVVAGVFGMTVPSDRRWSAWAEELAARLVVGTTVVAAVLLVAFGLLFGQS